MKTSRIPWLVIGVVVVLLVLAVAAGFVSGFREGRRDRTLDEASCRRAAAVFRQRRKITTTIWMAASRSAG
jgi:hypothetical protein